jgi:hypothetical protein
VELFEAERKQHGMNRRSRIYDNIDGILRKDWRPIESVPGALPEGAEISEGEDVE